MKGSVTMVVLILAALAVVVVVAVCLARVNPRNPALTMAFGFLLVLAGGLLMLATRGIPPGVFFSAGLLLLASGVAGGAVALRGARGHSLDSASVD